MSETKSVYQVGTSKLENKALEGSELLPVK